MSEEPPSNSPAGIRDVWTLIERGNEWSDQGDEARAEIFFRAAVELDGEDTAVGAAWFNLGNALARQGRFAEAVTAFLRAVEFGDTDAPLNLGSAYEELEDWTAAEAAFRQALACGDPGARRALHELQHPRARPAISSWRQEVLWRQAVADGDIRSAAELGCWLFRNDPERAEHFLRQGMDADDDARADLAWLLRGRDELDEAQALLEQGVARGHTDSMLKLALLLEEDLDDPHAAEAVLRGALAAGELSAHNNLGALLWDRGDLFEAQQEFLAGARGGDILAARNGARLRRTHRRALNRAHRARRARGLTER